MSRCLIVPSVLFILSAAACSGEPNKGASDSGAPGTTDTDGTDAVSRFYRGVATTIFFVDLVIPSAWVPIIVVVTFFWTLEPPTHPRPPGCRSSSS